MYLQKCQMILVPIIICKKQQPKEHVNMNQNEKKKMMKGINVHCPMPALLSFSTEWILRLPSMR